MVRMIPIGARLTAPTPPNGVTSKNFPIKHCVCQTGYRHLHRHLSRLPPNTVAVDVPGDLTKPPRSAIVIQPFLDKPAIVAAIAVGNDTDVTVAAVEIDARLASPEAYRVTSPDQEIALAG